MYIYIYMYKVSKQVDLLEMQKTAPAFRGGVV